MLLRLCKTGLLRNPAQVAGLLATAKDHGITVKIEDCLDKCLTCETRCVAILDGATIAAKDAAELTEQLSLLE